MRAAPVTTTPAAVPVPGVAGPDHFDARTYADRILANIDWSKRDIILNVPGTGDRLVLNGMRLALARTFAAHEAAFAFVDYDTNWDFQRSVPKGLDVLKLVLAGIAAHGGDHRIFLFGQSQGALVIGEAMADRKLTAMVERAAIWGHPNIARHHYPTGVDPRVWEFSNADDPVAYPLKGSAHEFIESLGKLFGGDYMAALPPIAKGVLRNLPGGIWAGLWLMRGKVIPTSLMNDPHGYDHAYTTGMRFLREGMLMNTVLSAVDASQRAQLVQQAAAAPSSVWQMLRD